MTFAFRPYLRNFHFVKCIPLSGARLILNKNSELSAKSLILNKITKLTDRLLPWMWTKQS